ncbi:hypothetical protein [Selenomonas ruminantium]|uniref:Uncharacterized protein n=1 Tax=Selenomonas ruminantium TaxID=971 RepID=A0A1I0Y9T2_SELRU|nr:hypothetical protein [Selenomonas ruminantium]SFB10044.1 hypothetical protein SAMN05216587_11125 [Selenomonas ruminantium]
MKKTYVSVNNRRFFRIEVKDKEKELATKLYAELQDVFPCAVYKENPADNMPNIIVELNEFHFTTVKDFKAEFNKVYNMVKKDGSTLNKDEKNVPKMENTPTCYTAKNTAKKVRRRNHQIVKARNLYNHMVNTMMEENFDKYDNSPLNFHLVNHAPAFYYKSFAQYREAKKIYNFSKYHTRFFPAVA